MEKKSIQLYLYKTWMAENNEIIKTNDTVISLFCTGALQTTPKPKKKINKNWKGDSEQLHWKNDIRCRSHNYVRMYVCTYLHTLLRFQCRWIPGSREGIRFNQWFVQVTSQWNSWDRHAPSYVKYNIALLT